MKMESVTQAHDYLIQINTTNLQYKFPRLTKEQLFTERLPRLMFRTKLLKLQGQLNPRSDLNRQAVRAYLGAIKVLLIKIEKYESKNRVEK